MRLLVLVSFVCFTGCDLFAGGDPAGSLTLELLSPKPGSVGATVQFRARRSGPLGAGHVYAAKAKSPQTVERTVECPPSLGPTCEGTIEFPAAFAEETWEVWADQGLNDEAQRVLVSERQQVQINATPIVLAPLTLNDPKRVRIVVAGKTKLDPETLGTIRVERRFARLPYIDLPNERGFGYGTVEVPVTAALDGQFLDVRGDFRGPAFYTLHLDGVANEYGLRVKAPLEVEQSFFGPPIDVGDVFISGVGIPPHFERASDGRLFLVVNQRIQQLAAGTWSDVATWTGPADATIAPDGTPYLFDANDSGGRVQRWTGTAWETLPLAPCPPAVSGAYNYFVASLAVTPSGQLFLATMRSPTLPVISDVWLYRWDGAQWQQVLQVSDPASTGFAALRRFGDGVALDRAGRLELLLGATLTPVPDPRPVLAALGSLPRFSWANLRHDADGRPWLLGSYDDVTLPGNEPAIAGSGTAALALEGNAWQVKAKGSLLQDAWVPTASGSNLFIREVQVRSWTFDPTGAPVVFTRETVNPNGNPIYNRLNISAFRAQGGAWGPLADAPSPMLVDELKRVPGPFMEMAPSALYDGVYDADGGLWAVTYAGSHGNAALETFVLNYHR